MLSTYRETIEYTSDFIWEVDYKGVYTYVNKVVEKILGYTPAEMIGKTPFDFMPEEEQEKLQNIFTQIVSDERDIENLENINIHKDGSKVVLETNGRAIFNDNGTLIGYRGIDRNITEKKELEVELAKKNLLLENLLIEQSKMALIGEMMHNLSNKWKQPLAEVLTASSGIQLQREYNVLTNQTLDHAMNTISSSAKKLTKEIQYFDIFLKNDTEKTIFELDKTVSSVLDLLPMKGISVEKKLAKCTLIGLEKKLIQVLANIILKSKSLLNNSSSKEKYIFIHAEEIGDVVHIKIKDTSGKSSGKLLDRIFSPSATLKYLTSENINLYTCKEVINSYLCGSIEVKNVSFKQEKTLFHGVEFTVLIPKIVI